MKQLSWSSTPVAVLGSAATICITLLHYAHAHQQGVPGGYFAVGLGAIIVGLLAGAGGYFSATPERRAPSAAVAVGVVVSLVTAGLLVATLIWAFGS